MTERDIISQRIRNQLSTHGDSADPAQIVRHFGAVQAQDFYGSLWAIGIRTKDALESTIEQAIADRKIVRTWPMRGTLHFVPPEDVRWMLKLLTPRIIAGNMRRLYRQLDLNE